jgi:tetratricopeptide (TPR) repeat protein
MTTLKLRVLTVVWGHEFVDRFLKGTLRSLASPNNLPALASNFDLVYELIAPQVDIDYIKTHPAYRVLADRVRFSFVSLRSGHIDMANSMSHWVLWNEAIERARCDDAYVITVAADHIFADGAMRRWAALFEQGYLAVYCPGMQVVAETIEAELVRNFGEEPVITLPRDEMIGLMFRHFHPVMLAMCRASPRWMAHPEFHLRGIAGSGIVQRIMTSHSVAFNPARIAMTENFCPVEKLDKVAFEPSWFLSAEPFFKYLNLYLRPWRMDDETMSHYGIWGDGFFLAANLREQAHSYSYALPDQSIAPSRLRKEEIAAGRYVAQMQTARKIHRVWHKLQESGLLCPAQWLAVAHLVGRLRRKLVVRGPLTLLVPDDPAMAVFGRAHAKHLLSDGGRALIDAVRAHVIEGRAPLARGARFEPSPTGTMRSASGSRYAVGRGVFRVVRGPIEVDDATIWVINRPIWGPSSGAPTASLQIRTAVLRIRVRLRGQVRLARTAAVTILRRYRSAYFVARRIYEQLSVLQRARRGSGVRGLVGGGKTAPTDPATLKSLALYRRALNGVAHNALSELFEMYERTVLAGAGTRSVPALQIKSLPALPPVEIVAVLERVVALTPDFAEAWLELGCIRRGLGDHAGARAAFERARRLRPRQAARRGQSDLRAVAAYEAAREAVAGGDHAGALAALELSDVPPPYPWQLHALKVRLLVDLGDAAGALAEIDRAMRWDHFEGRFEGMLPKSYDEMCAVMVATETRAASSPPLGPFTETLEASRQADVRSSQC